MAFEWKKEDIKSRLSSLIDNIISIAKEDDVITQDEQDIIDIIRDHILSFEEEFAQLIEDHTSIETATKTIKERFEQAIEAAARQARKDGTITSDELILIDRLAKALRREDLTKYAET